MHACMLFHTGRRAPFFGARSHVRDKPRTDTANQGHTDIENGPAGIKRARRGDVAASHGIAPCSRSVGSRPLRDRETGLAREERPHGEALSNRKTKQNRPKPIGITEHRKWGRRRFSRDRSGATRPSGRRAKTNQVHSGSNENKRTA